MYKCSHNKKILVLGIIINVVSLGYFKYTNFFIHNLNRILDRNITTISIIVPIGISFLVFKAISYLVDIYKGKVDAEKNIIDFMLFMLFFPQVLSGPIVRYIDMKFDIKSRTICEEDIHFGLKRFIIGLAKYI